MVLLDKASSGDLLFIKKRIPKVHTYHEEGYCTVVWYFKKHLSNKKVGAIDISFMEYSDIKSVKLTPNIVEYKLGAQAPLYNLVIDK
jgi:hypothetical protein